MRHEFTAKTKLAAWERSGGHCDECRQKIIGRAEYDHVLPDWLGGEITIDNCAVLCAKCHRLKTSTVDVPRIAKTKRIKAKSAGIKTTSRKMAGGRGSKFKKLMSGRVVER